MAVVLGTDLGTTTITALAIDASDGAILGHSTAVNDAQTTSAHDRAHGYSEWDSRRIVEKACSCLRAVAEQLGARLPEVEGIGITGQQHGVVLVDKSLAPLTPLINWQDRRAEETLPGTCRTYVQEAAERVGQDAPLRAGCRLAAGYMAVTLFWMRERGLLPSEGTACFLMDYFAAVLTGKPPVTDPTCAASSGAFDIRRRQWDTPALTALGLPVQMFPKVRPSGDPLGTLAPGMAAATGLPAGLPVFVGIGDNQASFLGSVAERQDTVLVNVGTGGQVTAYTPRFTYDPFLETRPYVDEGYLLVSAGLCGGGAYALLERFYREVGSRLFGAPADHSLYQVMNDLAAGINPGADGLRCEPFFTGTRIQPELRGCWTGVSAENFTPGHLTRALLEGMAGALREGYERIEHLLQAAHTRLAGSGNGLRDNPVLAAILAEAFALPVLLPAHREEAACGAALLAALGAGIVPDLSSAGRLIRYADPSAL
jgi:sugar (pentulose or hexulose) kinase